MLLLKVLGQSVSHASPVLFGDCWKSLFSTLCSFRFHNYLLIYIYIYKTMHIFQYTSNLVICGLLFLGLFTSYPMCYYAFSPFYCHFGDLSPPLLAQPPLLCYYLLKFKNIICPLLYSLYIHS